MDFEAINRLRLKEAFGEFELFQQISKDEDWFLIRTGVKLSFDNMKNL